MNSGTQVHKHSIETNRQGIFVSFFPYKYALSEALGKLSFAQYQWRKYKQKNVVCVYIWKFVVLHRPYFVLTDRVFLTIRSVFVCTHYHETSQTIHYIQVVDFLWQLLMKCIGGLVKLANSLFMLKAPKDIRVPPPKKR